MRFAPFLGVATLALCAPSCAPEGQDTVLAGGPGSAVTAGAGEQREGTIFHLEGHHGDPAALWVEASYKIRREQGRISKTLEIDLEHAPPAVAHTLTLDGFALGRLLTSAKGKAEFELAEVGENYFPDGFEEPKAGSLLRIGELAEIHFLLVHKLTDLQVDITGAGKLSGKVGFKVERLGETVMTEFQVKVTHAEEKEVQPVLLDGVHVGDLSIDLAGKGKLLYSTLKGEPFPPEFQAPKAGSKIEIGKLYQGQLRDNLVDRGE